MAPSVVRSGPAEVPRKLRPTPVASLPTTPAFELVSSLVMNYKMRRKLKGSDDGAAECRGEGSKECSENRAMSVECENGSCSNRRLQRSEFVPTYVKPSGIHGQGFYVRSPVTAGEFMGEYRGELIDLVEFWKRYDAMTSDEDMYFCTHVKSLVIDSKMKGSYERFICHSCDPNAVLAPWSVAGCRWVAVVAIRDLLADEEVTVTYYAGMDGSWFVCVCGAFNCTGRAKRVPPAKGGGSKTVSRCSTPVVVAQEEIVVMTVTTPDGGRGQLTNPYAAVEEEGEEAASSEAEEVVDEAEEDEKLMKRKAEAAEREDDYRENRGLGPEPAALKKKRDRVMDLEDQERREERRGEAGPVFADGAPWPSLEEEGWRTLARGGPDLDPEQTEESAVDAGPRERRERRRDALPPHISVPPVFR
jgi:hypothetical protein